MNSRTREEAIVAWLGGEGSEIVTPAYVYDEASLVDSVSRMKDLFPPEARIFYSLKANPQPGVVRTLAGLGVGAEVASPREFDICRSADIPLDTVLVGGVCKSAGFIRRAIEAGVAGIVIDSRAEWARLKAVVASTAQTPRVLLRVNPGARLGGIDMGGGSQFGLSLEQALETAAEIVANSRVEFLGLHIYLGSQRLGVEAVFGTVDLVVEAIERFKAQGFALRVVDVGLGLGVPYLEKDDELPYAELRAGLLERWRRAAGSEVSIWSEAGRALVARSGYFVARVLETKSLHGQRFAMLDGGLNTHNPGIGLGRLFRSNPRFLFPNHGDGPRAAWQIVGNLCTSADCIGRDVLCPELSTGDFVVIPRAGAYCQTTALWGFNSQTLFTEILRKSDGSVRMLEPQHAPPPGDQL